MSLRLVNQPAKAALRISSALMSRSTNPKNITLIRSMCKKSDKKTDGTCKNEKCGPSGDSQFFAGCFKTTPTKPCPEKKQKGGPCKQGCNGRCKPGK